MTQPNTTFELKSDIHDLISHLRKKCDSEDIIDAISFEIVNNKTLFQLLKQDANGQKAQDLLRDSMSGILNTLDNINSPELIRASAHLTQFFADSKRGGFSFKDEQMARARNAKNLSGKNKSCQIS